MLLRCVTVYHVHSWYDQKVPFKVCTPSLGRAVKWGGKALVCTNSILNQGTREVVLKLSSTTFRYYKYRIDTDIHNLFNWSNKSMVFSGYYAYMLDNNFALQIWHESPPPNWRLTWDSPSPSLKQQTGHRSCLKIDTKQQVATLVVVVVVCTIFEYS